jgi:hypothetical protein
MKVRIPDGQILLEPPIPSGDQPSVRGDATGLIMASVINRDLDADADSYINRTEFRLGSDPLDPANHPPGLTVSQIPGSTPPVLWINYQDTAAHVGYPYFIAMSFGSNPGIPLSSFNYPNLPLNADDLFYLSLGPYPNIFSNFSGLVPGPSGNVQAFLNVPAGIPANFFSVFFGAATYAFTGNTLVPLAIASSVPLVLPASIP